MHDDDLKMYNTEQTAELLGMKKRNLLELRSVGVIKAIKTGRSFMFTKASIAEFQRLYAGYDVSNAKKGYAAMQEVKKKYAADKV